MNSAFQNLSFMELAERFINSYRTFVEFWFKDTLIYFPIGIKILHVLLITISIFIFAKYLKQINHNGKKLVSIISFCTLPIAAIINNVLMNDNSYVLTNYAFITPMIIVVLMIEKLHAHRKFVLSNVLYQLMLSMLIIVLFWYAIIDNVYYRKADITYQRTVNLCNRILSRIEQLSDFSDSKHILLLGMLPNDNYHSATETFDEIINDAGLTAEYLISFSEQEPIVNSYKFARVCDDILGVPLSVVSDDEFKNIIKSDEIINMPIWPAEGSVMEINNIVVVNMNYWLRISYEKNADQVKIYVDTSNKLNNIEYAYYLYKDGEQVDTRWYSSENEYIFDASMPGEYQVLAFARIGDKLVDKKYSDIIYVGT